MGGISQVTEQRAGHNDLLNNFIDAPSGSLINDRAIDSKVHERVPPLFTAGIVGGGDPIAAEEPVRTFRTSLKLLGDGFVEAIPNGTLLNISAAQAANSNGQVQGQAIAVPVLEANFLTNRDCRDTTKPCTRRIGRFGWKDQLPSLLSFCGDAYLNEIGITNFLIIDENTSLGRSVAAFDEVSDTQVCEEHLCPIPQNCPCAEDTERDIDTFTEFMRATKAPPQDKDIRNDPRFAADIAAGRQRISVEQGITASSSLALERPAAHYSGRSLKLVYKTWNRLRRQFVPTVRACFYSSRSATSGSTRLARRAGT